MSRYTLKTFCGQTLKEKYEHRSVAKLQALLQLGDMHRAGEKAAWGADPIYPDRFEIYGGRGDKLFIGNITEAINFARKLK